MSCNRRTKDRGSDRMIEEEAVGARTRSGAKAVVGRVAVRVRRIPRIVGMVCVGVRSRGWGVGARVIGGWRMRRSNIGHAIWVRRAGGRGGGGVGGRGLDPVGIMLIIGAVRRKRVRIAAIGWILRIANERLEKCLVPGTHCGQRRGRRGFLVRSRTKGANPAEEPGGEGG